MKKTPRSASDNDSGSGSESDSGSEKKKKIEERLRNIYVMIKKIKEKTVENVKKM